MKNAKTILSEHIHVSWDQEERIIAAMKEYANQAIDMCAGSAEYVMEEEGPVLHRGSIQEVKNQLV